MFKLGRFLYEREPSNNFPKRDVARHSSPKFGCDQVGLGKTSCVLTLAAMASVSDLAKVRAESLATDNHGHLHDN
jgi:hypothetical protein